MNILRQKLLGTLFFSLLLLQCGPTHAQNPKSARKGAALKHAEAVLGKPLSDAQKKAVRAANTRRQGKIKPIQEEYQTAVAKTLGLSLAQYKAREDQLRAKNKKGQ